MTAEPVKLDDSGQPARYPFHCGNRCPASADGTSTEWDPETDLYACGYRHWCPWCGDCEFCDGMGPHEWD